MRLPLYLYAHAGAGKLRPRMFSPLQRIAPGTGYAQPWPEAACGCPKGA